LRYHYREIKTQRRDVQILDHHAAEPLREVEHHVYGSSIRASCAEILHDRPGSLDITRRLAEDLRQRLYFYDPDCGHCKKETPEMVKAYKKIVDTMHVDFKVYSTPTMHLHKGEKNPDGSYKFSTDPKDRQEWTNFIKDYDLLHWINVADLYLQDNFRAIYDINSTPQVYLLDKDKKILAKRFSPEQLSLIIQDLEKRAQDISKSKKNENEPNALPEKSQAPQPNPGKN
jgi:hypothetical protein